jgi:cytochrome subunit of sulfide dehydrogenase
MDSKRNGMVGTALAALLVAVAGAANAQDTQLLPTRSLAANCAACHGTQGRAIDGAAVPGLAGMPQGYMSEQMRGFKSGARQVTLMNQLAKGYSDAQIEQLAAYFAAQKK